MDGPLELGEETKLLLDSAFENYLCTSGYKPKSEKHFFFLAYHSSRNWATAPGVIQRGPKYAKEPSEGSELPPAS